MSLFVFWSSRVTGCDCGFQSSCCFQTVKKKTASTEDKVCQSVSQWLHGTRALGTVGSCTGAVRAGVGSQGPFHNPSQDQGSHGQMGTLPGHWATASGWAWAKVRPGRCPVGEDQEQTLWGESGSGTVPGLLGRAEGTAPSEPRRSDQMSVAVCCDQGTTWAAGKALGVRVTA